MTSDQIEVEKNTRVPNWYVIGLFFILTLNLTFGLIVQPSVDLYWRIYIANGLLNGMVLYRDMIETNPPLWFWAAIPAAYLGGLKALVVLNLSVGFIQVMLFLKLAQLTMPMKRACFFALSFAIGLMLININEIGQREQSFLAACTIWSALLAARSERKAIPFPLIFMATLLCGYGFALKHYFVLFPIAAELLLFFYLRQASAIFRIENFGLCLLAVTYFLSVILLTPKYLTEMQDLLWLTYEYFSSYNDLNPLQKTFKILEDCSLYNIAIIAFLIMWKERIRFLGFLILALFSSIGIVIIQQKGFHYQYFAVTGLSTVLILGCLPIAIEACAASFNKKFPIFRPSVQNVPRQSPEKIETKRGLVSQLSREKIAGHLKFWSNAAFSILGLLFLKESSLKIASEVSTRGEAVNTYLEETVQREPPNSQIAIVAVGPELSFLPLAREKRAYWSRHYSLWMMHGLFSPRTEISQEQKRLKLRTQMLEEFAQDIMCRPPDVLVGEVPRFGYPKVLYFDSMAFLMENQKFATWVDRYYRTIQSPSRFPTWRLRAERPPIPEECAPWVEFDPQAQ